MKTQRKSILTIMPTSNCTPDSYASAAAQTHTNTHVLFNALTEQTTLHKHTVICTHIHTQTEQNSMHTHMDITFIQPLFFSLPSCRVYILTHIHATP